MSSSVLNDPNESVQLVDYGSLAENSKGEGPDQELPTEAYTESSSKCHFEAEDWGTGTATIVNEILNLVKNIVGSGGLSLPAGIAAFANNPSALIPSTLVIMIMGLLNAYSFSLLGRVCAATKSKTYQEAWDKTMGRRYGVKYNVWVGLVVTGKAVLGCWSFSIVIASTCQPLLKMVGLHMVSKAGTLLGITIFVLLPLCLLERLSSLAFFSVIGQFGTLAATSTMLLRYFDGTYRKGGLFYEVRKPKASISYVRAR
jgi:amino acid permease